VTFFDLDSFDSTVSNALVAIFAVALFWFFMKGMHVSFSASCTKRLTKQFFHFFEIILERSIRHRL
jgi:hypothetical protein